MAKVLENMIKSLAEAGFPCKMVDAPQEAVTFDKMLVVYSTKEMKTIKLIHLYSSKQDKFLAHF